MKNKAKCKQCLSIIESFHETDYVTCKCGEISVYGGNIALYSSARDYTNFLRVDDEGNEIVVKFMDKEVQGIAQQIADKIYTENQQHEATKSLDTVSYQSSYHRAQAALEGLKLLVAQRNNLPQQAMSSYVTHYDFYSALDAVVKSLEAILS